MWRTVGVIGLAVLLGAQAPGEDRRVPDAATFGAVAALAPLCGLRDDGWARDLRAAGLESLRGSGEAKAALGYGEMEALEDFAADGKVESCAALARNPALGLGDAAVAAYRRRHLGVPVG